MYPKGHYRTLRDKKNNRRSVAVVYTAVSLTAMIGFTALAVDVGYVYQTKAQLQRTADAAAMAAASQMTGSTNIATLRAMARDYAQKNAVGKVTPTLTDSDVVLGQAVVDSTGKATFTPGAQPYDAVKVTIRMTEDSPNGAVPLFFGKVVGKGSVDISASAIAMLVPRDIAVVIDLSRSMNYDSQLRREKNTAINIEQVWKDLGSPTFGKMTTWTSSTTGMIYNSSDSSSSMVSKLGLSNIPFPYSNGGSWSEYCKYVRGESMSTGPSIPDGNPSDEPNYKYCYGLRTFVNYLLAVRSKNTNGLGGARMQPMYALKQAVQELDDYLTTLNSSDRVSLHSYADTARTIQQLTSDFALITQKANQQWAGGQDGTETNISAGIDSAVAELTSSRARQNAKKVIFLMTDGVPTRPSNETTGTTYTVNSANNARSKGIQIYTISLGSETNETLMANVSGIGKGSHYHVPTANIAQYSEDLKNVFRTLGGKRPVRLIQ